MTTNEFTSFICMIDRQTDELPHEFQMSLHSLMSRYLAELRSSFICLWLISDKVNHVGFLQFSQEKTYTLLNLVVKKWGGCEDFFFSLPTGHLKSCLFKYFCDCRLMEKDNPHHFWETNSNRDRGRGQWQGTYLAFGRFKIQSLTISLRIVPVLLSEQLWAPF